LLVFFFFVFFFSNMVSSQPNSCFYFGFFDLQGGVFYFWAAPWVTLFQKHLRTNSDFILRWSGIFFLARNEI